jgi:hypothetical protein
MTASASRPAATVPVSGSLPGTAICTNESGLAVFELIRRARHGDKALDGKDLRRSPIEYREAKLAKLVQTPQPGIVLNEHYEGDGDIIFQHEARLRRHRVEAARIIVRAARRIG